MNLIGRWNSRKMPSMFHIRDIQITIYIDFCRPQPIVERVYRVIGSKGAELHNVGDEELQELDHVRHVHV